MSPLGVPLTDHVNVDCRRGIECSYESDTPFGGRERRTHTGRSSREGTSVEIPSLSYLTLNNNRQWRGRPRSPVYPLQPTKTSLFSRVRHPPPSPVDRSCLLRPPTLPQISPLTPIEGELQPPPLTLTRESPTPFQPIKSIFGSFKRVNSPYGKTKQNNDYSIYSSGAGVPRTEIRTL